MSRYCQRFYYYTFVLFSRHYELILVLLPLTPNEMDLILFLHEYFLVGE